MKSSMPLRGNNLRDGLVPNKPDGSRHDGKAACIQLWTGIATNPGISFETECIIARGDRGEIRWRLRWGPEHGSSVRGVNLMRVRNRQIVEALGYVKGA